MISESSSSSRILAVSKLEALKIRAFLEEDPAKKKIIIDQMARMGPISVPQISQLVFCSIKLEGRVSSDVLGYCKAKIKELTENQENKNIRIE